MNVLTKALTRLRRVSAKQIIVASVFAIAVVGAAGAGIATRQQTMAAPDCGTNSIIPCGYSDPADLINKLNSNASYRDIEAQVGHLSPSDYARFVSSAKAGTAFKDGTIVVDGRVVATDVWSLGRHANSNYPQVPYNVDGQTLYASADTAVMIHDSIPVFVLFNAQGEMQAAIMTPCGNPITTFKPVKPNYSCDALQMSATGKLNEYSFSSAASAGNGASINHVVYDFGDGSATVSQDSPSTKVTHAYTKAGNWTAKVTVYVNLPAGGSTVIAPAGQCVKSVKVEAPFFTCSYLQVTMPNESNKLAYHFSLKATAGNGATFTSVDFDFGDGNKASSVKPANGALTVETDHTYSKAGNYNVTPTLHFTTPTGEQTITGTGNCVAKVSPTLPPQPCQPGGNPAPGSQECSPKPCTPGGTPAPGSPECTPATPVTTLPNTGAGNVVGIFAGTSLAAAAAHYFLQKRRLARNTL